MKAVFILLLLAGCAYSNVRYVIDGDTFVLNNGSFVRLLGIDAPEKGSAYYDRSAYELQKRIAGRKFELEFSGTDIYGRLLAFVRINNSNVNVELVRNGWARIFLYNNTKYAELLESAQQSAISEKIGIWNFDEASYQRLSSRCPVLGCENASIAVASRNGDVFYNCACLSASRIGRANILCFTSIQDAIALGFSEAKRC